MKHNLTQNLNKLFLCTQMRFGQTPTLQQAIHLGNTETGNQPHRFVISESRQKQTQATQDEFITRERNNVMTVQKVLSHLSDDMTTKLVNQTVENGSVKTMWQMLRSPKKEGLSQDIFQSAGEKAGVKLTGIRGFFNRVKLAVGYFFKSKKGTVADINDTFKKQVSDIQAMAPASQAKVTGAVDDIAAPVVTKAAKTTGQEIVEHQSSLQGAVQNAKRELSIVMQKSGHPNLKPVQNDLDEIQRLMDMAAESPGVRIYADLSEKAVAITDKLNALPKAVEEAGGLNLSMARLQFNSIISDNLQNLVKLTGKELMGA